MKIIILLSVILCWTLYHVQAGNQHQKVLLSNVQTLTLLKGQRTQARRVSSIPQLKCVGGSAKGAYEPDVVQCYNRGSNGIDIQWECKSEMPTRYKFGEISVSCEGYDYPDDPYILAGSCGLEYKLELTDTNFHDSKYSRNVRDSSSSRFWPFLFKVALIVIVFFVVKSYLAGGNGSGGVRPMSTGPDHRPPGGGGGWFSNFFPGTGGSGHGDARRRQPPPPGFRDNFNDFGPDCTANQQGTASGDRGYSFLSGAALGALGGYVFGSRNRQQTAPPPSNTGNTSWFGSGSTTTTTHRRTPSPSSSSSTYTSTSYGGTSRR